MHCQASDSVYHASCVRLYPRRARKIGQCLKFRSERFGGPPHRRRWTTIRQAEVYTREAERAKTAAQAAGMLDETGTSIPSPMEKVRAADGNSQ
jgi:hypothetical protein